MLSLTKKTEYALIACCYLARVNRGVVSARDIAQQHSVRVPLLMNVLKVLNQRGLLKSARGARGGYTLAVPADELSLARVIEAVEGPARLVRCAAPELPRRGAECELVCACPVRSPLFKVHERFERFLAAVTVADLAFDECYGRNEAALPCKVIAE